MEAVYTPNRVPDEYQTLKGVCFFEADGCRPTTLPGTTSYQTLKGVCFFEAVAVFAQFAYCALYQTLKGVCFFEASPLRSPFT